MEVSTEGLWCCASRRRTTQHPCIIAGLISSGVSFPLCLGDDPPLVTGMRMNSFLLSKHEHNVMRKKYTSPRKQVILSSKQFAGKEAWGHIQGCAEGALTQPCVQGSSACPTAW